MTRFYFTVRFLPESANVNLLVGRCLFIMHGYITKHIIQGMGVSLPEWQQESVGAVVAFVHSDNRVLNELKQQNYFKDMQDCGFFAVSEVTQVPVDCPEVRFKRNQTIKKIFTSEKKRRLKRLEKRAKDQGKEFNPEKFSSVREFDFFHRISVASVSKSADVELYIQKQIDIDRIETGYNSYGLATNEKHSGTVPDLSKSFDSF
ncbi:type I-F CRISPR-associated endoribonuclease Cas6/Csy4 [Thalassotalea piscium]|uniref:CRISPR-associated endonuclease Csy4 n=1 Tax=Thalassotalea piscium TaxID=1230533 RepID=A0A7X0NGF1_9GAMM|nr:type I-F CRISPR-associated endoribonuclease Cas6/Csy4 [Thalassotalea piscium]MBB6542900.1 CRISPR-associated endonuclease Csy4 [Thalassotalea piscium]